MKNFDRKLVWAFFLWLMLEGIFRKWFLPSFATQIMVAKQFLACYMVFRGYLKGYIKSNWATFSIILGFIGFCTTLLFGHQNLSVAVFGCLQWWFGIPLAFYIKSVLQKGDIIKMMRFIFYFAIAHFIVTAVQFSSPTVSLINIQIGGEIIETNETDIGKLAGGFRPTGLFGYNTMSGAFDIFAFAIILFYLFRGNYLLKEKVSPFYIDLSLILYVATCLFSVSRGLIFQSIIILFFLAFHVLYLIKKIKISYRYVLFIVIAFPVLLSQTRVQQAIENLVYRFEDASESQYTGVSTTSGSINDVLDRSVFYLLNAILEPRTLDGKEVPFFGFGQGLSTQIGGKLAGNAGAAHSGFALAEWDGLRIVCESGVLLGLFMLICRIGFALSLYPQMRKCLRKKNYLPLLLYCQILFLFGPTINWGNLWMFNFSMFFGGFLMATMKFNVEDKLLTTKS